MHSKAKYYGVGRQIKHRPNALTVLYEPFTEDNSYVSGGHDVTHGISKFSRVTSHEKTRFICMHEFSKSSLILHGRKSVREPGSIIKGPPRMLKIQISAPYPTLIKFIFLGIESSYLNF